MATGDLFFSPPFLRIEHSGQVRSVRLGGIDMTVPSEWEPATSPAMTGTPGAGTIVFGHWGVGTGYSISGSPFGVDVFCRQVVAVFSGSVWQYGWADGVLNGYRPTGLLRAGLTSSAMRGLQGDYKWENEASIEVEFVKVNNWEANAVPVGSLLWRPLVVD